MYIRGFECELHAHLWHLRTRAAEPQSGANMTLNLALTSQFSILESRFSILESQSSLVRGSQFVVRSSKWQVLVVFIATII